MKRLGTIFFLLMATSTLLGQNTLSDTVKINAVIVTSETEKSNQEPLDSAIINNPQHLNLGDLLSKKSHLFIKSYGIGSLATVSLRGSGSAHTQLNWNGISLNSSMNGSSDLALFPLFFMDEVGVNYGLNSMVDGTGGIGGAVTISTVPEFKKQSNVFVSANFGSFGQRQLNSRIKVGNEKFQSVTKLIHNKAENNFEYEDITTEGFPTRSVINANFLQRGIMQSFFFKLNKNQLIEANLWYFESERNLPPLITLRENKEVQEDKGLKGLIKYAKYFDKSILKVTAAFIDDQLNYQNERASIDSRSQTKSIRTRVDYEFNFRKINLHSQVKFDHNQADADELINNVQQKRLELFTKAQRTFYNRIVASFSVRTLHVVQNESYLLPQLRLDYQIKNVNLFALVGKNVKYPNLNDLFYQPTGNVDLQAEQSESVELGSTYKRKLFGNKINFISSITLFYNNIENYIQWEPTAFGFWRPINLKSVETMGSEVFLSIKQSEGKIRKELSATYSYTSSKNFEKQHQFDESNGKQLIYIPEHKGNVSLSFDIVNSGSQFFINYQMIGIRYISSDNEELLPSYSLLDVGVTQFFILNRKYSFDVTAGVKNILDAEYQAIEWRPMPNRNYFIKIQYQFGK